jgi:SAM-dependent methyltransferase
MPGTRVTLTAVAENGLAIENTRDAAIMSQGDAVFVGAIPQLYDRCLGPTMFMPYHAAAKPGLGRIEFRQADALGLPFDDRTFDAVVCQFGVMFFPDRRAAFREARRVLKPGGRFLFNVWGSVADNPLIAATLAGLSRQYPQQDSWFLARTPCGYRDPDVIRADLAAAGFADCRIETLTLRGPVASPEMPALGFCQGSPMRAEIEALDPNGLQQATDAAAAGIAEQFGSGAFDVEMRALVIETVC